MIILRKGKKTIREYVEPFAVADDVETLGAIFPAKQIEQIQHYIRRNAFFFAIRGAKVRLGGGVMLETVA